jgi:hypothetical protein
MRYHKAPGSCLHETENGNCGMMVREDTNHGMQKLFHSQHWTPIYCFAVRGEEIIVQEFFSAA